MDSSAKAAEVEGKAVAESEQESRQEEGQQPPPEGRERRKHPRYACDGYAEVHLPHAGLHFRGRIQNLSASGCYIETELNLERGTYVEVLFRLHQLGFRVAGNVTGVDRRAGVRIAFLNVSSRNRRHIGELVLELAEKSSGS